MLPKIWIIDTYSLMILMGVVVCFILFNLYTKKYNISKKYTYDIYLLACVSIMIGLGFAILFQLLFDLFSGTIRGTAMTFYGGLVGGVLTFLVGYFIILRKRYPEEKFSLNILPIAPCCITVAHGFGRIGCFLAGCCYGDETSSWLGVTFPGMNVSVLPTQLFEALFLFILTTLLFYLAIKKKYIYTLPIYLASYGVFRFLLEFLRGDNRGAFFLNLSPSQWFSIIALITSCVLIYLFKKKGLKNNVTRNN